MLQTAPHRPAALRADSQVPEELRGQVILLHFLEPVPRFVTRWFYQCHPDEAMRRRAEDKFRLVERFQPGANVAVCPNCGMPMRRLNELESRCTNRLCVLPSGQDGRGVRFVVGPKRGMVRVLIAPEWVVGNRGQGGMELVDRCALVMDRRYDDAAREAMYGLAGVVAELARAETGINLRLR